MSTLMEDDIKRWTTKRKTALVPILAFSFVDSPWRVRAPQSKTPQTLLLEAF